MFSGRRNAIYLTREYYQDYACRFDLIYYPFDTQLCLMIFEVQGKTDNYIKLSKDSSPGIEFLSTRKLVEYEIQMEALEFRSVNNISQGIVKFVFRRNMEFHVTNTFLQTFLLTCVGYQRRCIESNLCNEPTADRFLTCNRAFLKKCQNHNKKIYQC